MGSNLEITSKNNNPELLFIDKKEQIENVGNSLKDFQIIIKIYSSFTSNEYLVKSLIKNKLYHMKEFLAKNFTNPLLTTNLINYFKPLLNIHHPNLVTYYSVFTENGNLYYISNYVENSLNSYFAERISENSFVNEKKIWWFLVQSLRGLLHLHKLNVYHGNLNLNSFVLDNGLILKLKYYMIFSKNESSSNKFQSDICDLGNIFSYLIKNTKYYSYYSGTLKDFITKLIQKKLSSSDAFRKAVFIYTDTYIKNSGILSCIHCLIGIKKVFGNIISFNKEDINQKYIITYTLKNIFLFLKSNNIKFALAYSIKLRILLFNYKEEGLTKYSEIDIIAFLNLFIEKLHDELNQNIKDCINSTSDICDNYSTVDTTENGAINEAVSIFKKNCRSLISDEFFYLSKTMTICYECNNIIKCTSQPRYLSLMFPKKASIYVNKKEITVQDLFKHYMKTIYISENLYCCKCNKFINKIKRKSMWYTSPKVIIIVLDYKYNEYFNLNIAEIIDITNYVENKIIYNNKIQYRLAGVVLKRENHNSLQYCGIRKEENGWMRYDGELGNVYGCTFYDVNNPGNNLKPKILFYNLIE